MVANDQTVWFARSYDNCEASTGGMSWSLDSACNIHLTLYCESFNQYEAILIDPHYVTDVNTDKMQIIRSVPYICR